MNALVSYLISEFQIIYTTEYKKLKSTSDERKIIEDTMNQLEAAKSKDSAAGTFPLWYRFIFNYLVFPKIDVLKALFLVMDHSKNAKVLTAAVGCFQKLITHHAIYPNAEMPELSQMISIVLDNFIKVMSSSSDIQLKILQSLLPLISHYDMIHKESLVKIFRLCFNFLATASTGTDPAYSMVHNSAEATLRQLVIIVFGKAEKILQSLNPQVELSLQEYPTILDAYCLFKDFCYILQGNPGPFLGSSSLDTGVVLELIESIIACHPKLFLLSSEMSVLLSENLVTSLAFLESKTTNQYPICLRILRIHSVYVKAFLEHSYFTKAASIYLEKFLEYLEDSTSEFKWQGLVSLEILRSYLSDKNLVQHLNSAQYLQKIFQILEKIQIYTGMNHILSLSNPVLKQPLIDVLEKSQPPPIGKSSSIYSLTYISLLVFQCILSLCKLTRESFMRSYFLQLETITLAYFNMMIEQCNNESNEDEALLTVKGYFVFGLKNLALGLMADPEKNPASFNLLELWFERNKDALDTAKKTDKLAFSGDTLMPVLSKGGFFKKKSSLPQSSSLPLRSTQREALLMKKGWIASLTEYLHLLILLKHDLKSQQWTWAFRLVFEYKLLEEMKSPVKKSQFSEEETELNNILDVYFVKLATRESWNEAFLGAPLSNETYILAMKSLFHILSTSNVENNHESYPFLNNFVIDTVKNQIQEKERWLDIEVFQCLFVEILKPFMTKAILENHDFNALSSWIHCYYKANGRSFLWFQFIEEISKILMENINSEKTIETTNAAYSNILNLMKELCEIIKAIILEWGDSFKGQEWSHLFVTFQNYLYSQKADSFPNAFQLLYPVCYRIGQDCLATIHDLYPFILLVTSCIQLNYGKIVTLDLLDFQNFEAATTAVEKIAISEADNKQLDFRRSDNTNACLTLVELLWKLSDELMNRIEANGGLNFSRSPSINASSNDFSATTIIAQQHLLLNSFVSCLRNVRDIDIQSSCIYTFIRVITVYARRDILDWKYCLSCLFPIAIFPNQDQGLLWPSIMEIFLKGIVDVFVEFRHTLISNVDDNDQNIIESVRRASLWEPFISFWSIFNDAIFGMILGSVSSGENLDIDKLRLNLLLNYRLLLEAFIDSLPLARVAFQCFLEYTIPKSCPPFASPSVISEIYSKLVDLLTLCVEKHSSEFGSNKQLVENLYALATWEILEKPVILKLDSINSSSFARTLFPDNTSFSVTIIQKQIYSCQKYIDLSLWLSELILSIFRYCLKHYEQQEPNQHLGPFIRDGPKTSKSEISMEFSLCLMSFLKLTLSRFPFDSLNQEKDTLMSLFHCFEVCLLKKYKFPLLWEFVVFLFLYWHPTWLQLFNPENFVIPNIGDESLDQDRLSSADFEENSFNVSNSFSTENVRKVPDLDSSQKLLSCLMKTWEAYFFPFSLDCLPSSLSLTDLRLLEDRMLSLLLKEKFLQNNLDFMIKLKDICFSKQSALNQGICEKKEKSVTISNKGPLKKSISSKNSTVDSQEYNTRSLVNYYPRYRLGIAAWCFVFMALPQVPQDPLLSPSMIKLYSTNEAVRVFQEQVTLFLNLYLKGKAYSHRFPLSKAIMLQLDFLFESPEESIFILDWFSFSVSTSESLHIHSTGKANLENVPDNPKGVSLSVDEIHNSGDGSNAECPFDGRETKSYSNLISLMEAVRPLKLPWINFTMKQLDKHVLYSFLENINNTKWTKRIFDLLYSE